jgi:hypothetical protein
MAIPSNTSDEELILMVDNKPDATELERCLADHLAERKVEVSELLGEIDACGGAARDI